jgi:hypothetical protein
MAPDVGWLVGVLEVPVFPLPKIPLAGAPPKNGFDAPVLGVLVGVEEGGPSKRPPPEAGLLFANIPPLGAGVDEGVDPAPPPKENPLPADVVGVEPNSDEPAGLGVKPAPPNVLLPEVVVLLVAGAPPNEYPEALLSFLSSLLAPNKLLPLLPLLLLAPKSDILIDVIYSGITRDSNASRERFGGSNGGWNYSWEYLSTTTNGRQSRRRR